MIDVTGCLDLSEDDVTAMTPSAADYREGTSVWMWDDVGIVGLPRVAIEAIGATWDEARFASVNVTSGQDDVLVVREKAPPLSVHDEQGRPRILGAGPLSFHCLEPFQRWEVSFDGRASTSSAEDQIAACTNRSTAGSSRADVPVRFRIDARMAAPPWVQGSLDPDGQFIVGERRFEQLFVAEGTIAIDGDERPFHGGGLRIHRKGGGRSDYSDWYGHCWQSTLFPSGRAFGYIHYTPRPDGSVKYHEGWVLDDGQILPAKVVDTPWKRGWDRAGEDVSFTLRTTRGDVTIRATTHASTFNPAAPMGDGVSFPPVQQGIARYVWDDEEAFGMIERSTRSDLPDGT